jgi:DNA topoisomerase-1
MGKVDQLVSGLQKLYSKRGALDKQIADAEKKLTVEAKAAAKPAPAKKSAAKKPAARKSAAKKSAAPKPAAK